MTARKHLLTEELVREHLQFDPISGVLRRGARAVGNKTRKGYLKFQFFGNYLKVHRVAWLLATGSWPVGTIDHINGQASDNRLGNLRDVPLAVNLQNNRRAHGTHKTSSGKYRAEIFADGRRLKLGLYSSFEQAHETYLKAKRTLHPGFAG